MTDPKFLRFTELCIKSFSAKTLLNIVFSSPVCGDVKKIKGTLRSLSGDTVLYLEYFLTEGRVRQENVSFNDLDGKIAELSSMFSRCDLNFDGGNASLLVSKKGKVSLVSHGDPEKGKKQDVSTGQREKKYILKGDEAFLYCLGVSDKNGRIHDKKQGKFRQINRFLEYVSDMMKYLPKNGELRVADLCCGKSYLSFAVYHYLVNILKRDVKMDCMDLKESVMRDCNEIAERCGFSQMKFTSGDVNLYAPEKAPHMVISLHACDIATDIVIDRAICLGASVILSTPCCHRDLSRKIDSPMLKFICDNSVLKSKFCDAATDSLRVLRLRACGYTADATEFTDPEDTPKNVLIRARIDRGFDYGRRAAYAKEYEEAYRFLTSACPPLLPEKI